MIAFVLKITITPLFVCLATLAGRRWGHTVSGWLVALPLTAGPVVLFLTIEDGPRFGASAAAGCLAGTLALTGFNLAYAWRARSSGLAVSLLAGTSAFVVISGLLFRVHIRPISLSCFALLIVTTGLMSMPRRANPATGAVRSAWGLPFRMAASTVIVLLLTALARKLGPSLSGTLAALPVYAGTLTAFAHHSSGWQAGVAVLRGSLYGLYGYAAFFFILSISILHSSLTLSFMAASVTAAAVHGCSLWVITRRAGRAPAHQPIDAN